MGSKSPPAGLELLPVLQAIPGPSGDEGGIADFLQSHCSGIANASVRRHGDLLIVSRGQPRVGLFAHIDTIGFTLGPKRRLIPIGGPKTSGGERLQIVSGEGAGRVRLVDGEERARRLSGRKGVLGSNWVYAAPLVFRKDQVIGAYLDNRAGVWNAIRCLEEINDVAVAFTPGEEHSGRGAAVAARIMHDDLGIRRALISDISWHTRAIKNGKGPVVSYRDRSVPRRRYLDAVLEAAAASGVPFQHEVESDGGSDGSVVDRSPYPIDWVFVGAPQKQSHTPREECRVSDLLAMLELYRYLVPALSRIPD